MDNTDDDRRLSVATDQSDLEPLIGNGSSAKHRYRQRFCSCWRRAFLYHRNNDFAESFEIAFRGAFWLLLFGSPAIWGLTKSPQHSVFNESTVFGKMFQTGAIVCFVYTLAPTVGITLNYAVDGTAGTVFAAIVSWIMYQLYPDGCYEMESFSSCYAFGPILGGTSIIVVLVIRASMNFQIFYCANLVWFTLAFMKPTEKRSDVAPEHIFGFEFQDWGGGVFDGVIKMVSGAILAVMATLLPYPMTSMEQARESAVDIVSVLSETWTKSIQFYLANDIDEETKARMIGSISSIKSNVLILKEHLNGTWWEMFFVGPCSRTYKNSYNFLSKLEEITWHCFERLSHVVDACAREQFEDMHDKMMEGCGDAARKLSSSSHELLALAVRLADDGRITAQERENLKAEVEKVEKLEQHLSKAVKQSLEKLIKEHESESEEKAWQVVSEKVADERIFMFSLCDYASQVQVYSKWLADQFDSASLKSCECGAFLRSIVDKNVIFKAAHVNVALRSSISMLIGFTVGYYGYYQTITEADATIPATIAVLLSKSVTSPLSKSFQRLLGVVLGRFCGKLAYALLGWCDPWAHVSLSVVIFSYAWLSLFVYYYTSEYSNLGCLAAAFGTQVFLQGCSTHTDAIDEPPTARVIMNMVVAIGIMILVDLVLRMGRPSELAYRAYLDAWSTWDDVLEQLLSVNDSDFHPGDILSLITSAEALGNEAATEPRLWKSPFPKDVFSNMISLARTMRTQVVCIHTVICENEPNEDGTLPKKKWFKDLLADEKSDWPERIKELLLEMDKTYTLIEKLEKDNGSSLPAKTVKRRRESLERSFGKLPFTTSLTRESYDEHTLYNSLVDDNESQQNFVYGCLQSIFQVNHDLRLQMLKAGVV